MNRQKPDSRELLRRISKLSSDADWNPDENQDVLAEAGISATEVTERIVQLVKRALDFALGNKHKNGERRKP